METERDTISWSGVGLAVATASVGLFLLLSEIRPAAYFVLGYSAFVTLAMLLFKTWRVSSEVKRVQKRQWKRMVGDIPRGILRYLLGILATMLVILIGIFPVFFLPDDLNDDYQQILYVYTLILVGVSFVAFFLVSGFGKYLRQIITDLRELREAVGKARERRKNKDDSAH